MSLKIKASPLSALALVAMGISTDTKVSQAQSITAAPDGTGTIINHNGNTYHIEGGTTAGTNLFHSFEQFGLNPQEIANFLSNPNITNVLGRVTGGDPSIIQGLIKLSGGNSNLFLMNPAGWVFTQGASLDVPGSFGVTTATRIGFGDGYFNAYGTNTYNKLIGNPISLIFDQDNPSFIVNQGNLTVPEGESLWMVGGGVISTGTIEAPNGNITLTAVPGKNQIELSHEGMVLDLILKATPTEGEVTLPQGLTGIRPTDIPALLTGGDVKEADTVIIGEDGSVRLVASDTTVKQGDTVIAGNVTAENITLMAAGRVTPTDYNLISNNPTVVLFPEALGDPVEATFIDEGVQNHQNFLYGGEKGTISQIVTHQENGIDTVTASLTEIANQGGEVSAVHLLTEGNEGEFWLGNAYVNNETIKQYKKQLEQWGVSLSPTADILLYACYTALGDEGMKLIQTLADSTGADVAASSNLTGNAQLGGDWELERIIGRIEARLGFEQQVLDDFKGKLAVFTASNETELTTHVGTTNSNGDADTINLAGNITLTSAANTNGTYGDSGFFIAADGGHKLTINGMGNSITRNASAPTFRIMRLDTGSELELKNTTLSGGIADDSGTYGSSGGGILNVNGTLTLSNSTVSENSSVKDGGGIFNRGTTTGAASLTLTHSTISDNSAGKKGGGILNRGTATDAASLTLTHSTISNNSAAQRGGGIYNYGDAANAGVATLTNSTVSRNSAAQRGGGFFNYGTAADAASLTLTNSTVSSNSADSNGGGVYNLGNAAGAASLTLTNSTISNNFSNSYGGGIYNYANITGAASVTVGNSIIADNTATSSDPDMGHSFSNFNITDQGNNLIGIDSIGFFTTSTFVGTAADPVDPGLLPLGDYGGLTQTHALKTSSVALNAGSNTLATGLTNDQRGTPGARFVDNTVDIGAFEWQGAEIIPIGAQNQTSSTLDVSVKVVEQVFNVAPVAGENVDFSTSGTVQGSFTNGTTVKTDANGVAANAFEVSSATEDFTVVASATGLESLTFNTTHNRTNDVAEEVVAEEVVAEEVVTNSNSPDVTPIGDELAEDVLLGNICQTRPEWEWDDDGEEMSFEEEKQEEEEKEQYYQECCPVNSVFLPFYSSGVLSFCPSTTMPPFPPPLGEEQGSKGVGELGSKGVGELGSKEVGELGSKGVGEEF